MEWKTSIAKSGTDGTFIRGYELEELIRKVSFTQAIYLVLKGELPKDNEERVLDAIFVACIDHGIAPPSIIAARAVASGGNTLNNAVAAGVSTLGSYHGGAIDACAKILNSGKSAEDIVNNALENKKRLAGFGHKIYTEDPRTKVLFEIAKENGMFGKHCELALEIEKTLEEKKGRKLCLNIDGAIAALILEMGFPASLGKAFFIIPRTAGICAHVHEELTEEKPVRRLDETVYTGKDKREI